MILDVHTGDTNWNCLCWCLPAVMVLLSLRAGLIYQGLGPLLKNKAGLRLVLFNCS